MTEKKKASVLTSNFIVSCNGRMNTFDRIDGTGDYWQEIDARAIRPISETRARELFENPFDYHGIDETETARCSLFQIVLEEVEYKIHTPRAVTKAYQEMIRNTALAKLTDEEKAVLGL